ncbi:MAG: hypothetical protein ACP5G6_08480 [Conexivisphaera sp.]
MDECDPPARRPDAATIAPSMALRARATSIRISPHVTVIPRVTRTPSTDAGTSSAPMWRSDRK